MCIHLNAQIRNLHLYTVVILFASHRVLISKVHRKLFCSVFRLMHFHLLFKDWRIALFDFGPKGSKNSRSILLSYDDTDHKAQ